MYALARLIEAALDEFFLHATDTTEKLADMQGKVIALTILNITPNPSDACVGEVALFFRPIGDGVRVSAQWDGEVDVRIVGTAFDLYRLARVGARDDAGGRAEPIDVRISGDVDLGRQFMELFVEAGVTVEDMLSGLVGQAPAHWLASRARDAARVGARTFDVLARSAGDYLREEARVTPDPLELRHFARQVDELRDACARFEARLRRQTET